MTGRLHRQVAERGQRLLQVLHQQAQLRLQRIAWLILRRPGGVHREESGVAAREAEAIAEAMIEESAARRRLMHKVAERYFPIIDEES